jgi:peroxiredoxin
MGFLNRGFAAPVLACMAVVGVIAVVTPATRGQIHRLARAAGVESVPRPVRVNEALRPMQLQHEDGTHLTLGPDQRGTYVYNVFTTWCPSCREETPAFARVAKRLQQRGIKVIGIDQGESASAIDAFAQRNGLTYPIVIDYERATNAVLGANLIPTTVVVRDGVVRAMWSGPLGADELEALVDRAS